MSSKFGGRSAVQKPPAVCKKAPPPDVVPRPPFNEWFFQGYASWYDPAGTDRVLISGPFTMVPDLPDHIWIGSVEQAPYSLLVTMEWFPTINRFDFTIELFFQGSIVGRKDVNQVEPRSADPFDSGMIIFTQPPGLERIDCRIMS